MQRKKISIAIPASVVSDVPHLREKTSKIGLIGRAAAIFGVEEIIIYKDEPKIDQRADINLISTLLTYMETPQYLRKKLFKLRSELRYAGILPPLRTPHHPLGKRTVDLKVGEYREGVTTAKAGEGTLVDVGVEKLAIIPGARLPINKRVTVKIAGVNERVVANLVDRKEIPYYWGYKVTVWEDSFGKHVKTGLFDLKIATSKYGAVFADVKDKIAERWRKAETVLVVFGAPAKGLYEIAKHEGLNIDEVVDFVVNTVPGQMTETMRTEEALFASLAVFNCVFSFKV
jgi:predicted SPOUT superfamily RNA methylase MTH1